MRSAGIATPDEWLAVARRHGAAARLIALDPRRFPHDVASLGRYGRALAPCCPGPCSRGARRASTTPSTDSPAFTDIGTNHRLTLRNGVLVHVERPVDDTADATLTVTKGRMLGLLAGDTSSPGVDIAGDTNVLDRLLGVLGKADPAFDIVTP